MPDSTLYVAALIGCSVAGIGGARLVGTHVWRGGMLAPQGAKDWPHGVQEGDAPRFDVANAAALQASAVAATGFEDLDGATAVPPELIELHVRRYDPRR
jgi:hypothetical protein